LASFKLKRGYDIALTGAAEHVVEDGPSPAAVSIQPPDFHGLIARPAVEEGATVKIGTPLFRDKTFEQIVFTSPVSGMVVNVDRGERRAITDVIVRLDESSGGSGERESLAVADPSSGREGVLNTLLESGLFPFLVQRPLARLANPELVPRDIFVSVMDTAPLAASPEVLLRGREDHFVAGVRALGALTTGSVHLGADPGAPLPDVSSISNARQHSFAGRHPAGNVGTHIHKVAPVAGRNDVVWTCSLKGVLMIGALFATGQLDPTCLVAVAGDAAPKRRYVRTVLGARVDSLLAGEPDPATDVRYVSGNPLTGTKITPAGFVGFFDSSVTLLPEVVEPRLAGWLMPGFHAGSMSKTFLSAWLARGKPVRMDTGTNGGVRAFIATGIYRDVSAIDIHPEFLMKSILAEDIPQMEGLGIHEIAEEDVALCEYICPSKIEWQEITRQGLDLIEREA
jgi:Na+-transporting NADH:ubiquinone oxidoreductase subunit A